MLKKSIIIGCIVFITITQGLPVPDDEPAKTGDLFGWGGGGNHGGHHHHGGGGGSRPIQNLIIGWIGRWIGQQLWQGVFG